MKVFLTISLSLMFAGLSVAQDATNPVGFLIKPCIEGSDTWISTPFEHVDPVEKINLKSRPRIVTSRSRVVFYLRGSRRWTKNEFVGTHYVRIAGNHEMAGRAYPIVSHGRTSISVSYRDYFPHRDFRSNDKIEVVPYPTLDDIFPPEEENGFNVSTGILPSQRGSELLVFSEFPASNTPTPERSFFLTADGWNAVTNAGVVPAGDATVKPWEAMLVRNRTGAGSSEVIVGGKLSRLPRSLPVNGEWNERYIIPTPLPVLVPVTLAAIDLSSGNWNFNDSTSLDAEGRRSELLVYDPNLADLNKSPSAVYFRFENQWRFDDVDAGYPVSDDVELQPGTSVSIRKQRSWFNEWRLTPVNLQTGAND